MAEAVQIAQQLASSEVDLEPSFEPFDEDVIPHLPHDLLASLLRIREKIREKDNGV